MSQVEFEVTGLDELAEKMAEGSTYIKISLNEGLRKIGRLIVPAKGTGPLADETPKITGKLARSSYFTIEGGPENQSMVVRQPAMNEAGDFYGWYVREGTEPHDIRPKNKLALRFYIGGNLIFAKVVHHPGNRPNKYHHRVMAGLHPAIQNIVTQMGKRVTARLSGG